MRTHFQNDEKRLKEPFSFLLLKHSRQPTTQTWQSAMSRNDLTPHTASNMGVQCRTNGSATCYARDCDLPLTRAVAFMSYRYPRNPRSMRLQYASGCRGTSPEIELRC